MSNDSNPPSTMESTERTSSKIVGRRAFLASSATGLAVGLAGCAGGSGETSASGNGGSKQKGMSPSEIDIGAIQPDGLVGKGPNGHDPVPTDQVTLSDKQVSKIRDGDYKVSLVFHYLKTAWTKLQTRGLKSRFEELGVTVEGVHGAEFDAARQADILQTLAQKDLDAVVSIPVDQKATADAYRELVENGIDVMFMDNVPAGFKHPDDYIGTVAADNRGNGIVAGRILEKLVGSGKIGLIMHDSPFYVTEEREEGVKSVLNKNDNITTVKQGFTNPEEVYSLAQNMLTANPDMKGMFAIWQAPPGKQAVTAIKDSGKSIPVTTIDLGEQSANIMAEGGLIKGLGAQRPFDQGVAEANMVGHSLLGNDTPPYVAVQSLAVMRQNLIEAYEKVFHEKPPKDIAKHFE